MGKLLAAKAEAEAEAQEQAGKIDPEMLAMRRRPALPYNLMELMSYDVMELIAAYTSRAGVDQRFRVRAGEEGGFLSQAEWTGSRQEYDYVVPSGLGLLSVA